MDPATQSGSGILQFWFCMWEIKGEEEDLLFSSTLVYLWHLNRHNLYSLNNQLIVFLLLFFSHIWLTKWLMTITNEDKVQYIGDMCACVDDNPFWLLSADDRMQILCFSFQEDLEEEAGRRRQADGRIFGGWKMVE